MNVHHLEQGIRQQMPMAQVPGLAIAVIEQGDIAYLKGFGVRSTASQEPVSEHTVFQMASLSKPLFAYAVLQLVESGLLALDTPLSYYLPRSYLTHDARIDQITARHVLSHSAGFPNWRPGRDHSKGHFDDVPLPIESPPGSRFSYSGEGFWYLQHVVEQLTGQDLDTVMQARVFTPLALRTSSYVWQAAFENTLADGHDTNGREMDRDRPTVANAAYSLHSSVTDYARFVRAFLSQPDDLLAEIGTAQVPVGEQEGLSWGLGWGIQHHDYHEKTLWHWGANPGYRNFMVIHPTRRTAVLILTNSDHGLEICDPIVQAALNISTSQPAFQWILPKDQWRADGTTPNESTDAH
ncbi:MAG: beta-lactamase family protein [Anaerolineae bacterium]|nr:beta-lactamase family protein [Anaerolineae bacterium]